MKKLSLAAVLLMALLLLAACGGGSAGEHVHSFGEWTVAQEATCQVPGLKLRSCSGCTHTETETLSLLAHVPGEWRVVEVATCRNNGLRLQDCTVCGTTLATEDIPVTFDHSFGEWQVIYQPSCTSGGRAACGCTVCGVTEEKTLPAEEHTPGEWITVSQLSCFSDGYRRRICIYCGTEIDSEFTVATGHTPGEWITVSEPSCSVDGFRWQLCSVCGGEANREVIPATGHTPGEWVTVTEATKGNDGLRRKTCAVCGATAEEETIPALGHTAEDITIRLPSTPVTATETSIFSYGDGTTFEYYRWAQLLSVSYEIDTFYARECKVTFTITGRNAGIGDNGKVTNPGPAYGSSIEMILLNEAGEEVGRLWWSDSRLLEGAQATDICTVSIPYGTYSLHVLNTFRDSGDRNTPSSSWEEIIP